MKYLLAVLTTLVVAIPAVPAQAHYVSGCQGAKCKEHVIKPHIETLKARGDCESAGRSLKSGLRVLSPGGKYRGRYQFDFSSWRGAGGKGDPIDAGWREQAYRAVVWDYRHGGDPWPNCP